MKQFVSVLASLVISSTGFGQTNSVLPGHVNERGVYVPSNTYYSGPNSTCSNSDYFKQNQDKCSKELAAAWRANKTQRTQASYNRYTQLNKAAMDAGLTYVFSDNAAGNVQNKQSNGMVYASVDANGNIINSSDKQSQNANQQKKSAQKRYDISEQAKKDYALTDEEVESLEGYTPTGKLSGKTSGELTNVKNFGNAAGAASGNKSVEQLKNDYEVLKQGNETNSLRVTQDKLTEAKSKQGFLGRTFNPSDELKQARADSRAAKKNDQANGGTESRKLKAEATAAKTAERAEKSRAKQAALQEEQLKIGERNESGQYGGRYGGASRETTQALNTGVQMLSQTMEQGAANVVANKNQAIQMGLMSKGATATQTDAMKAQVETAMNGAKSLGTMATATNVVGGIQTYRAIQHLSSRGKVDAAKIANDREVQRLRDEASKLQGPDAVKKLAEAEARAAYGAENAAAERQAQGQAAAEQMMVVANTAMKAQQLKQEKKNAIAAADMMAQYAAANQGQGFIFAPNPGISNPNGDDPNNPGNIPNQVTNNDTGEQGIDAGGDLLNPNLGDGGLAGPAPGEFKEGAMPGQNGAPAGSSLAGGGGTSAAKDDSKGENGPPGKAQAGGSFAAGDNAGSGSRFARGAGGGGGADNNWLEMMKKFLPGGDEVAKHDERIDMTDRAIASDQPSVLGRNKNIFEEISKKYQKKNTEGAIVFTGDRT